jgi:aspartyl-tRNA(Asn)/glutamyl-tRNA(Gln) amidotransferase subunit B
MNGKLGAAGYEPVIGLEIHVQLKTSSKMFCGCRVEFGAEPNIHVCPVCLGLPGALPAVNERAIELAILAAVALNCRVHTRSVFARKNYFYPDLPKGYQISQYDRPLATDGLLDVPDGEGATANRVRVRRLHVEEDSGKSLHDRFPRETAVDLNRAGVPLAEIVTEPDLRSPAEARAFLGRLKQLLEYLEVGDCNMEEGSLRVDANVSVRRVGSRDMQTKTELKNMNSFSQLEKALRYEAERHIATIDTGGEVEHQTMLWDPARNEARPMRGKEEVHDYRYFPEPDLLTLQVSEETVTRIDAQVPELPWEKVDRLVSRYGLPRYDAEVLASSRSLADYFESVAETATDPKAAAKWVMVEVLGIANEVGKPVTQLGLEPPRLADLIGIVQSGTLSHGLGRQVLQRMVQSGKTAEEVMDQEGLRKVSDGDQLENWVAEVIRDNPGEVERYRGGEEKLVAFFMGQAMRKSQGKADPDRLRQKLLEMLGRGR